MNLKWLLFRMAALAALGSCAKLYADYCIKRTGMELRNQMGLLVDKLERVSHGVAVGNQLSNLGLKSSDAQPNTNHLSRPMKETLTAPR